ncbi:MAG: anthranilate phosphoribosyltransferase [Chthonomonas sp.]|nr:anthranilate phosphoribosyltransferase [Chthonomonas sp.]
MIADGLQKLMLGESLSEAEARELFRAFLSEDVSPLQKAAALGALAAKRPTADELVGFVTEMREHMVAVPVEGDVVLDTCGTGGGPPSFNLSTGAAFVAAAAGVHVAKHGNRAVSSKCGSADVLEALGANLELDVPNLQRVFRETGMQFLFAPNQHPAMRVMGPIRREIGVRTVFNWLGPLANPARANVQLIGHFSREALPIMAEAAARLGVQRGAIVHAEGGMDEVSPVGVTSLVLLNGELLTLAPRDFGIGEVDLSPGETVAESADVLRLALSGRDPRRSDALIPSVAVGLWLAGRAGSIAEGAELARETLRSGAAERKLNQFVEATRS